MILIHTTHDSRLSSTRRIQCAQPTLICIPREDRFYDQFQSFSNSQRVSKLHWIQVKLLKTLRMYNRFTRHTTFDDKSIPIKTEEQDKTFMRKMIRKINWRKNQIHIILSGFPAVQSDLIKRSLCTCTGLRRVNFLYSQCPNLINPVTEAKLSCCCISCKLNLFANFL